MYLLLQSLEFGGVFVNILTTGEEIRNKTSVYVFAASMGIVFLVSLALLGFHTYLMLKNFTTWEFVRWDRIAYLKGYKYRRLSPFSYSVFSNLMDYFFVAT